ncbi:MAG TPA: two-component regulator propeller domain-containing protein [Blastocatellia bacterium]|nr:two-component regulator propeller domain-containing protein [Blastocatellia bacterium]
MSKFTDKLKDGKSRVALLIALALLLVSAAVFLIVRLNRGIDAERDRLSASAQTDVRESRLRPPSTDGLTLFLHASDSRAVAAFRGERFLATSGGLVALDRSGSVRRRYTTLDGLPDNDLTSLAVFRDRLYIGTASAGLLAFDGEGFTGYRFEKPKATRISVLVPTESELLIGTLDGGLFEYDGERFTRRFNSAPGADFSRITSLLPKDSRLYIGTQDRGLYVWREAQIDHLSEREGLPSPRVTALARMPSGLIDDAEVAVATDFGVIGVTESNEVRPFSRQPNITSLAATGGRLWAGLFGGGIVDLSSDPKTRNDSPRGNDSSQAQVAGLPRSAPAVVDSSDGSLWALTTEGAFARDEGSSGPAFERVAASLAGQGILSAGHITSLALDPRGNLWVGYFNRGIDVIATGTNERLSHMEDERVREVNYVRFDPVEDRVLIATSRGLVEIDGRLKQTVLTRERNGIVNDSIAHVTLTNAAARSAVTALSRDRALVLATAGGLTEVYGGRARSITAFHGLASNHLYSSAAVGSRLFAGSLAGLVELEGLRVTRVYKTSNSRLSHDWVSALQEVDGTLFIGTNGGGIDALLPSGEWVSFVDQLGKLEVNQNAMHYDGERLYAGTTDRGLLVYNTRDRRWSEISAGLPSRNVTAIASDDRFIYAGTLNGLIRIEKRVIE